MGRHFLASDETAYGAALVALEDQPQILYSSEGTWTPDDIATPDGAVNISGGARNRVGLRDSRFGNPSLVLTSEFIQNSVPGH